MKSAQAHYAEVAYLAITNIQGATTSGDAPRPFSTQHYGQLCHRFPSLVLRNGLRLAVVYFRAQGAGKENISSDNSEKSTRSHSFNQYLTDMGKAVGVDFSNQREAMLQGNHAEYLHLSRKVLSASVWFKRYAEAILKVEQGNDEDLTEWRDDDERLSGAE